MDLKVFITTRESVCDECGEQLGHHAWITLVEGKGALCLSCADLDHLVFLPSGDAALTRRAV
jgi:formylmethanofuran dehydrogenase subunit E